MALTKVTGQVINSTTDLSVGVATVGGGTSTGDLYVVGVSTLVGDLSLNGNVSIGGTLTYEDVTNVDSVGLITARSGISVSGGDVKVGAALTISQDGDVHTLGVSTFTGNVNATANVLIGGPSHTSRPLAVHATTNSVVLIEGASNGTSSLMFGDESDEDVGMIQYNHADNDLAFTVNTGEALAIKSDGQLVASGTGSELNITNTGSTATEDTAVLYTSVSGVHNRVLIKTSTNNGGDPYIKFDGGGQDMVVGTRYAGTTNNLLVLGPGNDPDTKSGIFVKGNGLVGIGTDTPAKSVQIGAATPWLRLEETSAASKRLDLWVESSDGYIGANQSSSDLHFQTASSTRVTVTAGGALNIGASSPTASENGQFNCYTTTSSGKAQFVHDAGTGGLRLAGTGSGSGANLVFSNNYTSGTFSDHWTLSHDGADDSFKFRPGGTGTTETLKLLSTGAVDFSVAGTELDIYQTGAGDNFPLRLFNSDTTSSNKCGIYFGPCNNVAGAYIKGVAEADFTSTANRDAGVSLGVRRDGNWRQAFYVNSKGSPEFYMSNSSNLKYHMFQYTGGAGGSGLTVDLCSFATGNSGTVVYIEVDTVGTYGSGNDYIHTSKWITGLRAISASPQEWSTTTPQEVGAAGSGNGDVDIQWTDTGAGGTPQLQAVATAWMGFNVTVKVTLYKSAGFTIDCIT